MRRPVDPTRRQRERRRGQVSVLVAVSLTTLMAFAVIGLDVGLVLLTKEELQNAADAAALAGVAGVRAGDSNRAAQLAILTAAANEAVADSGLSPVVITAGDVEFPEAGVIRVTTHRTRATGDPLRTYFTRLVDPSGDGFADVTARAEAEAVDICITTCLRPWGLCDRFADADGDGTFDPGEIYDPLATGYRVPDDVGLQLVVRAQQASDPMRLLYFYQLYEPPLDTGQGTPVGGATVYRGFIEVCPPYIVTVGDSLLAHQGMMTGPLRQGVEYLIATDPGAYWDAAAREVRGSAYAQSPRLVRVALADPTFRPSDHGGAVRMGRLGAFFVESVTSNGRMTVRLVDLAVGDGVACEESNLAFVHRRRLRDYY